MFFSGFLLYIQPETEVLKVHTLESHLLALASIQLHLQINLIHGANLGGQNHSSSFD